MSGQSIKAYLRDCHPTFADLLIIFFASKQRLWNTFYQMGSGFKLLQKDVYQATFFG